MIRGSTTTPIVEPETMPSETFDSDAVEETKGFFGGW